MRGPESCEARESIRVTYLTDTDPPSSDGGIGWGIKEACCQRHHFQLTYRSSGDIGDETGKICGDSFMAVCLYLEL